MFALDHMHCARWLTIHAIDLLHLLTQCPAVYNAFLREDFVTHKTTSKFSCLAHDHVHEQQNAIVKGGVAISENGSALKRWMVAGPEIDRMLNE